MTLDHAVEQALRNERRIVASALVILIALAWWHVLSGAGTGMSVLGMSTWRFPPPAAASSPIEWTPSHALAMLMMWWVMMVAMMVPSAAPIILLHARTRKRAELRGQKTAAFGSSAAFTAGYLVNWLAFSIMATGLQWLLEHTGALNSMMMWPTSPTLTVALLGAAGLYQLTPLKSVCLEHCRSPVEYLARHWQPGHFGALRMGMEHGLYCTGCCWVLMLLLFAGGVMNLVWIAGLTLIVLAEKFLPGGHMLQKGLGAALLVAAGAVAIAG